MVQDAEKFADQDAKRKDLIEATNSAEGTILDIEKNLVQFAAQLESAEVEKVRNLIKQVREVASTAETAQILKDKVSELNQASMNLFQMVYQQKMNQNASGAKTDQNGNGQTDPKAEDAEFTEKK